MTDRRAARTIIDRHRDQLCAESGASPSELDRWIEDVSDGRWPDVDYDDRSSATWSPIVALERVRELGRAYRDRSLPDHGDQTVGETAVRALEYWLETDPESENWWYNEIGAPQTMRDVLALLEAELANDTRSAALAVLERTPVDGTGANLLWKAEIAFMHACFTGDGDAAARISERAAAEVEVTTEEGIQPDWSFHQHGPLLQQYHYGASFVRSAVSFATLVRDTAWAWPYATTALLGQLVAEGHRWMQRGGIASPSTLDRAIARPDAMTTSPATYRQLVEIGGDVDGAVAGFVDHLEAGVPAYEPPVIGHKHYWRSDFTVHHAADWSATLKTVSDATRNAESINGENLRGEYLTAGALFTTRAGDEYRDLMPVWDWHALPGTTAYADRRVVPTRRSFAGGIAVGRTGIDVLDYNVSEAELAAKKAWCFGPDGIVCLGAGITAPDGDVHTAIEQCRLRGGVEIAEHETVRTHEDGTELCCKPIWIAHDRMQYRFLAPATVTVSAGVRSGDWSRITEAHSASAEEAVFQAVIEHGDRPDGESYAYCVEPADADEHAAVLANTTAVQAVRHGERLQLAIHEAGEHVVGEHTISVDVPCLAQLGPAGLTVGDPSRRHDRATLTIDDERTRVDLPTDDAEPPQATVDQSFG